MVNNLQISPNQLEKTTPIYKELVASVAIAFERVGLSPEGVQIIDNIANDINKKYRGIELKHLTQAIKNGAMGDYGRTYRMSTQEVSIWIREYIKENPDAEPQEDKLNRLNKEAVNG